jgi:hypothetical protein
MDHGRTRLSGSRQLRTRKEGGRTEGRTEGRKEGRKEGMKEFCILSHHTAEGRATPLPNVWLALSCSPFALNKIRLRSKGSKKKNE